MPSVGSTPRGRSEARDGGRGGLVRRWLDKRDSSNARDAALAEAGRGLPRPAPAGEAIDPGVFAAEHPEHAERLARLLSALELMDDLRRSSIYPGNGLSLTPVLMESPGSRPASWATSGSSARSAAAAWASSTRRSRSRWAGGWR